MVGVINTTGVEGREKIADIISLRQGRSELEEAHRQRWVSAPPVRKLPARHFLQPWTTAL